MLGGFITFVIFAVVAWVALKFIPKSETVDDNTDANAIRWIRRGIGCCAVVFLACAALMILLSSLHVVPAGRAGLVKRFSAVTGREVGPGLQITWPFFESLVIYDTRVQRVPFENLEAASAEYQLVKTTGTLNYRLNADALSWLFQNVGDQHTLEEKVLVPALQQHVKAILPLYPILGILPNRDKIADELTVALQHAFEGYVTDDGEPVVFFTPNEKSTKGAASVFLQNLDFTDQFDHAVEEKQIQEQKVATEQNILKQKEIQKQQAITEAEGKAQANRLLAASLEVQGEAVVQLRAIDKLAENVKLIIVPEGQGLIPILGDLMKDEPAK